MRGIAHVDAVAIAACLTFQLALPEACRAGLLKSSCVCDSTRGHPGEPEFKKKKKQANKQTKKTLQINTTFQKCS